VTRRENKNKNQVATKNNKRNHSNSSDHMSRRRRHRIRCRVEVYYCVYCRQEEKKRQSDGDRGRHSSYGASVTCWPL
jgi:hypothetical protein